MCVCVCCVTTKFRCRVINTGNPRIGITNDANLLYPHCCVIGFDPPEMKSLIKFNGHRCAC